MMNRQILSGKWQQLQGEIRKAWGKLTDDDVAKVQGNAEKLAGLLRERYGWTQEEAAGKVSAFLDQMEKQLEESNAAAATAR